MLRGCANSSCPYSSARICVICGLSILASYFPFVVVICLSLNCRIGLVANGHLTRQGRRLKPELQLPNFTSSTSTPPRSPPTRYARRTDRKRRAFRRLSLVSIQLSNPRRVNRSRTHPSTRAFARIRPFHLSGNRTPGFRRLKRDPQTTIQFFASLHLCVSPFFGGEKKTSFTQRHKEAKEKGSAFRVLVCHTTLTCDSNVGIRVNS